MRSVQLGSPRTFSEEATTQPTFFPGVSILNEQQAVLRQTGNGHRFSGSVVVLQMKSSCEAEDCGCIDGSGTANRSVKCMVHWQGIRCKNTFGIQIHSPQHDAIWTVSSVMVSSTLYSAMVNRQLQPQLTHLQSFHPQLSHPL
jgi:hypothetical protein